MASWPFSLETLPLGGLQSPAASVAFMRKRLVDTLTVIDGVLKHPAGVPGALRQQIANARYHALAGIGRIDTALRRGACMNDHAADIDGLYDAINAHVVAVQNAKPLFRRWQAGDFQGFGATTPSNVRLPSWTLAALRQVAQPVRTGDYFGAGLATAGLSQLGGVGDLIMAAALQKAVDEGRTESMWTDEEQAVPEAQFQTNMSPADVGPSDAAPSRSTVKVAAAATSPVAVVKQGSWVVAGVILGVALYFLGRKK